MIIEIANQIESKSQFVSTRHCCIEHLMHTGDYLREQPIFLFIANFALFSVTACRLST